MLTADFANNARRPTSGQDEGADFMRRVGVIGIMRERFPSSPNHPGPCSCVPRWVGRTKELGQGTWVPLPEQLFGVCPGRMKVEYSTMYVRYIHTYMYSHVGGKDQPSASADNHGLVSTCRWKEDRTSPGERHFGWMDGCMDVWMDTPDGCCCSLRWSISPPRPSTRLVSSHTHL